MKDQILKTATDMFLSLGFKSVTMDDLARKMGISKKTIYSHFENKTCLVTECSRNLFQTICKGIECIQVSDKNPIEEMYQVMEFVSMQLKNEKASPQYQLEKYYPEIHRELTQKKLELVQTHINTNIEKGVRHGLYRDNLDKGFIARIYFAGMNSLKDVDLFPEEEFDKVSLMSQYLEYHLRGIVTPKGRRILNQIINSNQD
jgi:AcrR family transcriptional regulator